MDEAQYKKQLQDAGVQLPELGEADKDAKADEEAKVKADADKAAADAKLKADEDAAAKAKADADKDSKEKGSTINTEKKETKKRSIYDEYKDKKTELKTEKELREAAEKERDEFKQKLEDFEKAKTPGQKQEAKDELEKFAEEIKADPATLKRLQELFLKDLKVAGLSDEDRKILEGAKNAQKTNEALAEKQYFEEEFVSITPALKGYFPNVSTEDLGNIKKALDVLAHSKEWHDKDLDYVVYKNKEELQKIISPKKRGLEGKGTKEQEITNDDFDPNADYASMSPQQRAEWEKSYKNATKVPEGVFRDGSGKRLLL